MNARGTKRVKTELEKLYDKILFEWAPAVEEYKKEFIEDLDKLILLAKKEPSDV